MKEKNKLDNKNFLNSAHHESEKASHTYSTKVDIS